jgi:hypothetical protein
MPPLAVMARMGMESAGIIRRAGRIQAGPTLLSEAPSRCTDAEALADHLNATSRRSGTGIPLGENSPDVSQR